jgi:hypothetical protein
MKTEETILNYMDGTLGEDESAELLHQLSVSPENRVVLEQHIKLRELISLAQKPVAVPQVLEAGMAERFPAIAEYNRELSGGAAVVRQVARPGFISRMAASVAAFLAQYPVRTGFAVAAASVLGYFAFFSSNSNKVAETGAPVQHEQQTAVQPNNMAEKSLETTAPKNTSTNPSTATSQNADARMEDLLTKAQRTRKHSSANTASNVEHQHAVATKLPPPSQKTPIEKTPVDQKNIADNNNSSSTVKDDNTIKDNTTINSTINNDASVNKGATNTPKKEDAPKAVANNNNTPANTPPAPPKDMASNNDGNVGNHSINPLKNREENISDNGFAIRVFEGVGSALINAHTSDATLASKTEFTPSVGVDYSWSPNFSVGAEVGSAAISQLLTQTSVQPDAIADVPISRVVTSNSIQSASQIYGRLMIRYTVNPYDAWRFEVSGGAGAAFASKTAPLVSGSLFLAHDLIGGLAVYGGLALSGTWTSSNVQNNAVAVSSGDAVGYVTANHAAATLFTPSFSGRFGLKYRF